MASSSRKQPPSEPPIADAEIEDRTAVRPRVQPPVSRRARHQSGVRPAPAPGELDRMSHKLARAKALLDKLPATHPRARLLRIAIVRRDEVVIDGILADLTNDRR